jgi:hypothetical protein
MSGINWGLQNPVPQPIIAPGADKEARRISGDPVPARPDWLCITSPEFAPDASFDYQDKRTLTNEQRAAREEAIQVAREIRLAHKQAESDKRRAKLLAMKAHEKELRAKRAAENKKKGFGHLKRKKEKKA